MDEAKPKVVSLRGTEIIPPGEPRPKVIALCEELLERARSGDLMGLSVVRYHADDTHSYQHEGRSTYATIGAVEMLKLHLAQDRS
jgi:hypothetical protein